MADIHVPGLFSAQWFNIHMQRDIANKKLDRSALAGMPDWYDRLVERVLSTPPEFCVLPSNEHLPWPTCGFILIDDDTAHVFDEDFSGFCLFRFFSMPVDLGSFKSLLHAAVGDASLPDEFSVALRTQ